MSEAWIGGEIDRSPARFSATLAVAAGLVAVVAVALASPFGAVLSGLGILSVAAGLVRGGSRRLVGLGTGVVFVGLLVAGLSSAPVEPLLLAMTATVLVWDFGEHAISVGEHLGRAAPTRRVELTHAAVSVLVGAVTVGGSYVAYRIASGGRPISALVLLLAGAVLLTFTLRD